ncbi:MAG TPA: 4'-phosphopantetheinyl transferase superfamily protein [Saliniramus sp.]|nr:4'-phosphopantetheinyl transferase superfamily protein [Saliniramus sp.]
MRRGLGPDDVCVRWLETGKIAPADWPRLEAMLDDAERERARRCHFERDRQTYIAAHALVRATLSRFADRAPAEWRFTHNGYGKPEAVRLAQEPDLRVNLSHTRGLAAVAVTLGRDIGIDVEWMERRNLTRELGLSIFAGPECEAVARCREEDLCDTLFAFWTLKEAYIKAVGKGLAIPLDAFAFTLDPLRIDFFEPLVDDPADWFFQRHRPTAEHALALAIRHPGSRLDVAMEQASVGDLLAAAGQPPSGPGRISRR